MHLKARCYYSLRELFGCATTKQHAASVSAGHAFVSETRDRVTVWTCLLQREKAWQPLLSQVEPQKTLTCENYTRTSRSAALEKKTKQTKSRIYHLNWKTVRWCWSDTREAALMRARGEPGCAWPRPASSNLTVSLWGNTKCLLHDIKLIHIQKKKEKKKMEKTSAPCLASAHSCCVWSKDAGVFSALFMTCAVNVWPLVDNEAHWGEQ